MEQTEFVSYSSIIAGLLLYRRHISFQDIEKFTDTLEGDGIDTIDDEIDNLFPVMEMKGNCSFCLKDGMRYDDLVPMFGMCVSDYLKKQSNAIVLGKLKDINSCVVSFDNCNSLSSCSRRRSALDLKSKSKVLVRSFASRVFGL